MKEKELMRLIEVSKLYYEENMTQAEIARKIDVSRPSVSNLLNKARKEGIVKIEIASYDNTEIGISQALSKQYHLKSCCVVSNEDDLYEAAGETVISLLQKTKIFGLGWGYNINQILEKMPHDGEAKYLKGIVCPLIGTATVPHRGYHPNELTTVFSQKTGFEPEYLIVPAFPTTEQEQELFQNTNNYKEIYERWRKMDTALITLGSYPLVPDHGTAMRFGKKLIIEKAVSCLLSYFFNREGEIILGDDDFAIQIQIEQLGKIKNIIGVVPKEENVMSTMACLKTGYIKHLVITKKMATELLKYDQEN
jgi:DNA-binding transcriptional regulator LsrR (DeoR family)